MKSKQATAKTTTGITEQWRYRLREGAFIAVVSVCVYFFLALMSYSSHDPGWSRTAAGGGRIANYGGITGAYLADISFWLFGFMAFLFPVLLAYRAWLIFRNRHAPGAFDWFHFGMRLVGFVLVIVATCGLAWLNSPSAPGLPQGAGGVLGDIVGGACRDAFSLIGGRLVLVATLLFGITVFTDLSWLRLMDSIGRWAIEAFEGSRDFIERWRDSRLEKRDLAEQHKRRETALREQREKQSKRKPPAIAPAPKPVELGVRAQQEKQKVLFEGMDDAAEPLPKLELLNKPDDGDRKGYSQETLEAMSRLLELKLKDFNVDAEVVAVYPGPVITRFEIQPAPGVKVSKISNLAKDLARSLAVISVRVVEVIPGKSVVGIEIPNEDREMVYLSQVLASKAYDDARSALTLALGHDISGAPVVADLSKMPHLLVAGTTGSGKSVGVNAMLLSLLYKSTPQEVRLLLVDPKMLELSVYEGIPHLLTPVITDMKDAANGLRWCVGEMERRYKLMAALGVRNLAGCNRKIREAIDRGQPIADPLWRPDSSESLFEEPEDQEAPALEPIPHIVVVIDEFADMMMIVGKKVEELIARIAQKARAAGIHLILATQRPSVDVITGLIKANIPTRIAFQVSSKVDSRTILDQGGAEQLLGHGDMLYLPPGTGIPIRVHGAFVDDDEVHRVVDAWKKRGEPQYITDLIDDGATEYVPGFSNGDDNGEGSEEDSLYDEAVRFVTESRRASISAVQRKLRIGYNRAARMIESMEAAGVVSSMGTNGQREVLAPPPPGE